MIIFPQNFEYLKEPSAKGLVFTSILFQNDGFISIAKNLTVRENKDLVPKVVWLCLQFKAIF